MACTLTIDSATGQKLGNTLTVITVTGTVSDCDGPITVTIWCADESQKKQKVTIPVGDDWVVAFTPADGLPNCACNQTLHVHAECKPKAKGGAPQQGCSQDKVLPLPCVEKCLINYQQEILDCDITGTRPITIKITVTSPFPGQVEAALFEEPSNSNPNPSPGPLATDANDNEAVLIYDDTRLPGSYDFSLKIYSPPQCILNENVSEVYTLKVEPCIGACCLTDPRTGAAICVEVTQAECTRQGGKYLGNATSCVPNPCTAPPPGKPRPGTPGTPPPDGDGRGGCGGLLWAAVLLLASGITALAFHLCAGFPPVQAALQAIGYILIAAYGVLLFIWYLLKAFSICPETWCDAAKIHLTILGPLAIVLGFASLFVPCFFPLALTILTPILGAWAAVAADCL